MSDYRYLGKKVKKIRKEEGMTLRELSQKTGLSTGYLSQLERGMTTVAIDSLDKIAKAFNKNIQSFFENNHQESLRKREASYDLTKSFERTVSAVDRDYIQYHLLNDPSQVSFLPRYYEVLPQHEVFDKRTVYHHEGYEFIYVLEGILTIHLEEETHYLSEGDSILINSKYQHTWLNETGKRVRMLVVHSHNPFYQD